MAAAAVDLSESGELRPLRRVEYDQLIAFGAFHDEQIELIDGVLVRMSPIGAPHSATVARLTMLIAVALNGRAILRPQLPFAAGELSQPQPDLCVVPFGDHDNAHPSVAHVMIEVAESSLNLDRGRKARLYAESSVPEYWIVNLVERVVEVHTEPVAGVYQRRMTYQKGERITLVAFPEVTFAVDDFLK